MCIVYTDVYIQQKNMESFQTKLGLNAEWMPKTEGRFPLHSPILLGLGLCHSYPSRMVSEHRNLLYAALWSSSHGMWATSPRGP